MIILISCMSSFLIFWFWRMACNAINGGPGSLKCPVKDIPEEIGWMLFEEKRVEFVRHLASLESSYNKSMIGGYYSKDILEDRAKAVHAAQDLINPRDILVDYLFCIGFSLSAGCSCYLLFGLLI